MIERLAYALNVYLSKRWAVPTIALAALVWGVIVFAMSRSPEVAPIMICTAMGMPIMGIAFWVTSVAKWQFVNPRARLLPGFTAPHLVIIAGWFTLGIGFVSLTIGLALNGINPLAALAYGSTCGALFVWAIHTAKPLLTLFSMAIYFSPAAGFAQPFWIGSSPTLTLVRLAVILTGTAGIALWMWRLATLTEESQAYVIPTQAQAGKASRMEKSEARRNVATQLSRAKLAGWIVDRWAESLIGRRARTAAERTALLPYGHAGAPAWIRCLWLMTIMVVVVIVNILVAGTSSMTSTIRIAAPTALIFTFMGPAISTQLLAMRRARMQTELLWPMTRRQYIDGLFRIVAVEAMEVWIVTMGLLGASVAALIPELLRADYVVGLGVATLVSLVVAFGLSTLVALIESGTKRMLLLIVGLYLVAGLLMGVCAAYVYAGAVPAYGLGIIVLLGGVLLTRWSHRQWLCAELG